MICLRRGFLPQEFAHAGRTKKKASGATPDAKPGVAPDAERRLQFRAA
jgi:hypothetical protein